MEVNFREIFGWVLLVTGVGIIFWALYSSYNIFTQKTPLPEIFKMEVKEIAPSTPSKGKIPTNPEEIQKQLNQMIAEQLRQVLPTDTLPKLLNLTAWSILAGILIFGGGQIASLGIKLLSK